MALIYCKSHSYIFYCFGLLLDLFLNNLNFNSFKYYRTRLSIYLLQTPDFQLSWLCASTRPRISMRRFSHKDSSDRSSSQHFTLASLVPRPDSYQPVFSRPIVIEALKGFYSSLAAKASHQGLRHQLLLATSSLPMMTQSLLTTSSTQGIQTLAHARRVIREKKDQAWQKEWEARASRSLLRYITN